MIRKKILYTLLVLLSFIFVLNLSAQSPSLVDFGQNRVQYKKFKWQFQETENFRIYFYQGGQDIGKYVVLNAENILEDLSKSLDFRLDQKLDIIVYNDISDLRQSNIGLESTDPIENGQVKLLDNKLFVYFNGRHEFLDEQIKQGISKVFISKYVTGSGLRETFRNSISSSLPSWYTEGMTSYITYNWSPVYENQLKDGILSGRFKDLSKLNADEMAFVGHSVWSYVAEKYGKESLANLMYLVKVNRSVDRGFVYVTGKNLGRFLEEWYYYYLERFKKERETYVALDSENFINVPFKKFETIYNVKLNPKADKIAYTTNEDGKWRVHIYNIKDETHKVIFKAGFRTNTVITDLMNPMIDWNPRGDKLTMVYELRDEFFLRHYNTAEEKLEDEEPIRKFQKIFNFSYGEDSKHLVFSAMQKGQIDIFKYYMPSTKVTQLTNDFYDDLQPSFIDLEGFKGYLFISNRKDNSVSEKKLDTELPNGNFDVYFYDLENEQQSVIQVTNTPLYNESFPQAYNEKYFTFLSTQNGINNRYIGQFENKKVEDKILYFFNTNEYPNNTDSILLSQNEPIDSAMVFGRTLKEVSSKKTVPYFQNVGVSFLNSNYNNGISELSTAQKLTKKLELIQFNKKQRLVLSDYETLVGDRFEKTDYIKKLESVEAAAKALKIQIQNLTEAAIDTVKKEIVFQSKFDEWENDSENGYKQMLQAMEGEFEEKGSGYKFSRTRQYFLKFKADDVNFSLDNKLLITPYQVFTPDNPVFNNNGIGGFFKLGVKDLFENHKIHGGFRISDQSIVPREFYMTYENLTTRLDKEYTYYRNSIRRDVTTINGERLQREGKQILTTNYAHVNLKYALDILNSVRFKLAYRNEKIAYKATDDVSLAAENEVNNWLSLEVSFVHDHTIKLRPNTLQGFRANAYVSFQKEFPGQNISIFGDNVNLPTINNGYMLTWGGDARHYQKVYKTITWANRLAYSTSVGTRKVVYYLGGSDGQLLPNFDRTNDVNRDQNYAFQALAQQMRGFPQNTRNGNSYVVINSELRVPLFSAFSKSSSRSKLLESIELVGFFDIGTAWEGFTPWGSDNISTEIRYNNPLAIEQSTAIVKLDIYKDPIVFAFGPGLRADIFGYFFKFDLGWGYDTGELLRPQMHVSMTYDF